MDSTFAPCTASKRLPLPESSLQRGRIESRDLRGFQGIPDDRSGRGFRARAPRRVQFSCARKQGRPLASPGSRGGQDNRPPGRPWPDEQDERNPVHQASRVLTFRLTSTDRLGQSSVFVRCCLLRTADAPTRRWGAACRGGACPAHQWGAASSAPTIRL